MGKGKVVFKCKDLYADDHKCSIVVIEYPKKDEGGHLYYVNEFVKDLNNETTQKISHGKRMSNIARAEVVAKQIHEKRIMQDWRPSHSKIFGNIAKQSEAARISNFLKKYG